MSGEKLIPDWAISSQSFVLRSLMGQDFWELYKACCLDHQVATFGHNLSLKCSIFCHDKAIADLKIHNLQKELADLQDKEKVIQQDKATLKAKIVEIEVHFQRAVEEEEKKHDEAQERGKTEGFFVGLHDGQTEGLNEGRDAYLQSDEQKIEVSEHRFDKCVAQVTKLGGFAEGFDCNQLDLSLDANLHPYPEEEDAAVAELDEFAALVAYVENRH
ncbi:hypothetical protein Salat_2069300 [Sesamum alatum]|uniref:Uncharacterized protein n=1 Tax=Sesamum alatum TaxID=300844 RepID=A0AAE2CGD5_9LAMI|nr:hypothetical protein Salat_2069300 [Sesamum alatum]